MSCDLQASAVRQVSCPEPVSTSRLPTTTNPDRVDFACESPTLDKWLSCVVSYVNDPENFYCQLSVGDNVERLDGLMAKIETYVTALPPGIGKLRSATLGQPVIAKYSQDAAWYRARVTGNNIDICHNNSDNYTWN